MPERTGVPRSVSRADLLRAAVFGTAYLLAVRASEHVYGTLQLPSPFWLPDSVLLCALFLIPRAQWWMVFLLVWPIRLMAGAAPGTPLWFVLTSIANDSLKAFLAAWLLYRWVGRPIRLATFREFLIFLVVAVISVPLLSAILAAPARYALGDPLWISGYHWFMGDALAQMIVTPTLLYWLTGAGGRMKTHAEELALLAAGLTVVLYYAFVSGHGAGSPALLYAPVPFLIWAAVRLGPAGASTAITIVSFVTVYGAVNGTGVFSDASSQQSLLAVQFFLVLVAVSLLALAIVIADHQRRTEELKLQVAERQLAEEQVQELTGRLISAQDEERARIARELHDDVSQQLAFLRISIERFRQGADGLSADDRRQLNAIVDTTSRCASDIHQLSHRLHPSTMDFLSLVDTVSGLCREMRASRGMTVQFVHRDVPEHVDKAVKVCVVRIVQEGLRNVLAHSGVTDATVELSGREEGIELSISDAGRGFDLASAGKVPGLGLVSMRERLRALGGRLDVQSAPLRGTRIQALVPPGPSGAPERQPLPAAPAGAAPAAGWMIR